MQGDLLSWSPRVSVARQSDRPSIEERFRAFHAANPHVFEEALRLAREWLARGDKYISTKAILEVLRVSVTTTGDEGYRINNDFSAPLARALCDAEPALIGVIRMRIRKVGQL